MIDKLLPVRRARGSRALRTNDKRAGLPVTGSLERQLVLLLMVLVLAFTVPFPRARLTIARVAELPRYRC